MIKIKDEIINVETNEVMDYKLTLNLIILF